MRNQIKMLNTAAKQSPGRDAHTFMLITKEGDKKKERKTKKGREERDCRSAPAVSEGDGERKLSGREIK